MPDQPLWSTTDKDSGCTISNGDRTATQAGSDAGGARSTRGLTAGKWYVEFSSTATMRVALATSAAAITARPGDDAFAWALADNNGNKVNNGSSTAYGTAWTSADRLGMAIDLDNGKLYWSKNGTWYNSGDPAAGTGAAFTGLSGTFYLMCGKATGSAANITLVALASYSSSAPAGFVAGWGGSTVNQSLTATLTGTASIRRTTSKIVSATCTFTASAFKTVGKVVSGALPLAATLAHPTTYSRALSATLSLTGGMTRTVEKVVTGTVDLTAGMTRTVGKTLSATIDLTASLARALGVTLVATIDLSASMVRTIGKVLTGELPLVPDLGKIKAALVTMSADLTMTASMTAGALFTRVMEATISFSASMSRTIDKVMTAALPVVSKPLLWVATILGALRNDKPNWNQCARCNKPTRPNKLIRQMEYRGPRLVWTGLYVCDLCEDIPQPQGREPRILGGDPRPVPNARPRKS